MTSVPERPSLAGLEATWGERWEQAGTYHFDRSATRDGVYSIDTPPPTVSGSLHIGHVFSYTHTDVVARFQRMQGKAVWYPMGFDDNGLPTERRVQNYFGVRCDPSLPYDEGFTPPAEGGLAKDQQAVNVSRPNFVELCERLVADDERVFEGLWRQLGLSVDWRNTYTTIGERSRRASQRMFLRQLARGEAYQAEAPTLWDVDFQTAVAQAELEDRERPGAYHTLLFSIDGDELRIDTTRPELLPACVAVVAHPDDERYAALVGRTVTTPVFGVEVPFVAHPLAQPDKGTGVAMICTFGDLTDVTWWRELSLPVRAVIGRDGWFLTTPPAALPDPAFYEAELAGRNVNQARRAVVGALQARGQMVGEPRPINHPVKFYEKGDRPLEIVTSRQWFIKTVERQQELVARGGDVAWHPGFMQARYDDWVKGLTGDWLVSRQRFFGVPFPVWYRLDGEGQPIYDEPLLAEEERLPVDPTTDVPTGYEAGQRGEPGGFVADPDIMDTWATSSVTPQIAGGWVDDPDLFARVFPMDLRPQAHDIIRTWLFSTMVRSTSEEGVAPWAHAALSGWILDPDRKKMSKSKGNVVTPVDLLDAHGSDGVRYWAASARLGTDTAFDEGQMKIGRKLATKLLNASNFVLGPRGLGLAELAAEGPEAWGTPTDPVDLSLLAGLRAVVTEVTTALQGYEHARALERTEAFFWGFCDDYVELVKARAYGEHGDAASARATLLSALSVLLRLFAPILPFVTEEVWSWWHAEGDSVHRATWPTADELAAGGDPALLEAVATTLAQVRRAKTEAGKSLKVGVERLSVSGPAELVAAVEAAAGDLCAASGAAAGALATASGPELAVSVALAAG